MSSSQIMASPTNTLRTIALSFNSENLSAGPDKCIKILNQNISFFESSPGYQVT